MVETLLPHNATPFMRAAEAVSGARWALGSDGLPGTLNPWTCPADLLPWLAQTRGVDFWFDDWPEATKRRAIAEAPRLQRLKGTMAAVRGYLSLAGAEVTYLRAPSDLAFAGGLTPEQRAEWLGRLPQLRAYPFRDTVQTGAALADGESAAGDEQEPGAFMSLDPAQGAVGERLYIWRQGVEATLTVLDAERAPWSRGGWITEVTAVEPVEGAEGAFADGAARAGEQSDPGGLAGADPMQARAFTVSLRSDGIMQPIELTARTAAAVFETVFEPFEPQPGASFADHAVATTGGTCAGADQAAAHVFRRTYLADPAVAVPSFAEGALPSEHIANCQPVTAVLGVDVSRAARPGDMFNDGGLTGGFLGVDGTDPALSRAVEAVRRAQGGTDIFVIDSTTFTPVTAGDAPRAGDGITAGHMIKRYH
ncbi:phage tail protein I [Leisingera sp. ANG59]|uniref:phage tail protein I n=1 Tax=Leisingera sp. ANG59 TaxID=2675221 RepID=UPI001573F8CD|nr:phage tail protein I [Leisingera sp. ANG59]NSY36876.1 phage tail protein I [Leisingera sp. ANG59]